MQGRGMITQSHEADVYNTATTVDEFVKEELKKNLSNNSGF
jgi:hypothetical protein